MKFLNPNHLKISLTHHPQSYNFLLFLSDSTSTHSFFMFPRPSGHSTVVSCRQFKLTASKVCSYFSPHISISFWSLSWLMASLLTQWPGLRTLEEPLVTADGQGSSGRKLVGMKEGPSPVHPCATFCSGSPRTLWGPRLRPPSSASLWQLRALSSAWDFSPRAHSLSCGRI